MTGRRDVQQPAKDIEVSISELLQSIASQGPEPTQPDAENTLRMMRETLALHHPKVFQPGDTVTFLEHIDSRHPMTKHLPMMVIRMRGPEDEHAEDCPAHKTIADVLVLTQSSEDRVDIGWGNSHILRLWTPEIGRQLFLKHTPMGEAKGQS